MTSPTQTTENTTEVVYVSIYEQRQRSGKPRVDPKALANSLMKKDEKEQDWNQKYYDMNPEQERERKKLEYARKQENKNLKGK